MAEHDRAGRECLDKRDWKSAAAEFQEAIRLDPRHADAHIGLGVALWSMGDHQGGLASFQRAIDVAPQSAQAHYNVAIALKGTGENERAADELRAALKIKPGYEDAEILLALLLQQAGQPDRAIARYKTVLRRNPQSAEAHNWLGVAYLQKNALSDAEVEFRAAIKLKPDYVRAYNNLGSTLAQAGNFSEAIATLERALRYAPDDVQLRMNLAMAHRSNGDAGRALEYFSSLLKDHPTDPELQYQTGQTLRQKGDLPAAIQSFEAALELGPELQEAYYGLGQALKALASASRPKSQSKHQAVPQAVQELKRGSEALARGDVTAAKLSFQKATMLDPENAEAFTMLGSAIARTGDLATAVNTLEKALALNQNYADAHYNLGVALWYRGDRDRATAELDETLRLNPAAATAYSFRAMIASETGELATARQMSQRAIALNPNQAPPYFDLAVVFLRMGLVEQAFGQMEAGLNLPPQTGSAPDVAPAVRELGKVLVNKPSAQGYNVLGRLLGLDGADAPRVIEAFQQAIRLQPDLAEAHNNLGLVYVQTGDDEKAIRAFREAIRLRPDYAAAHQNLGAVLTTSDADEAVRELQKAIELQPAMLKGHYNLALAYDATPSGGLTKEIEELRNVIAAEPGYRHAEFALGKALLKSGKADQAVTHLQVAVRNEPDFGQAYYQLGLALARVGRKAESAEAIEKSRTLAAASERAENGNLDLRQGRAALEAGKLDEATATFERLVAMWPQSPQAYYYLGLVQKQQGDATRAAASFRKTLALQPGDIDAKAQLASLTSGGPDPQQEAIQSEISRGNFSEAEQQLHSYLDTHHNSSWGWYALGYCFYAEHKLGDSVRALAQSLQLDLQNAEAHKVLGRDMMIIGRFDAARIEFEQGMRYAPKSAEMPYNLGKLYSIQDNWALAKTSFERALALNPDFMEAHDGLGLALESLGQKEEAIEHYQKAIQLNEARHGHFGAPYVNMSALYNSAGDTKKALAFAQLGLSANPRSDRALYQLAKACEAKGMLQQAIDSLNRAIEINPNASSYFYLLATAYRRSGNMNESRKAMASFTKLNKLTNELEQKRINSFKEEGNEVQLVQRPAVGANDSPAR